MTPDSEGAVGQWKKSDLFTLCGFFVSSSHGLISSPGSVLIENISDRSVVVN